VSGLSAHGDQPDAEQRFIASRHFVVGQNRRHDASSRETSLLNGGQSRLRAFCHPRNHHRPWGNDFCRIIRQQRKKTLIRLSAEGAAPGMKNPAFMGQGFRAGFNSDGRGGWKSKSAKRTKRYLGNRASDSRQAVFASPPVKIRGSGL
jgi:hypothetical protein